MSEIDELIDLYEELDSPHEPVRKQVKIEFDKKKKECELALKLQEIFDQDLINWKASSEMKAECGHAVITEKFTKDVYLILKRMKEESEK